MKKLVILSSLFLALTVSAQQRTQSGDRPQKPTTEQQMKEFEDLNLTNKQKKKIKALLNEREANFEKNRPQQSSDKQLPPPPQNDDQKSGERGQGGQKGQQGGPRPGGNDSEFDAKLQKILTTQQYAQYKSKRESRGNSRGDSERPKNDRQQHQTKEYDQRRSN